LTRKHRGQLPGFVEIFASLLVLVVSLGQLVHCRRCALACAVDKTDYARTEECETCRT